MILELPGNNLKFHSEIKVWLEEKIVSPFIVQLPKPIRRIVIKHPLVTVDLWFYEKLFFLTKGEMVAQMNRVVNFEAIF